MMKTEIAFDDIKINSHHIDDNDKNTAVFNSRQ